jgi:mono/diheme cytochrome c family protein
VALSNRKVFTLAGLALFGALTLSTALAKPPKHKPAPKKPPMTKADPVAGKKVYVANGCAGCHKIGETGGESGPNLTSYASDKTKDAKWTAVQIEDPKKHKADSPMPGYAGKIKGKDMNNLVAYMLTLKG